MKALFWIFLLTNVLFFAVMRWGGLQDEHTGPLSPALHEEKITLQTTLQDKPVAELPAPAAASAALAPASAPMPASATAATPVAAPAACMEWGEFSGADLARATAALSKLALGDKLSQRQIEYAIVYWVYIPPIKDKAALNQKIAELKTIGINDYFIITDAGPSLNAISLGMFKTKEAAQRLLDELLRTKVASNAQIGERASKIKVTRFLLNGLDAKNSSDLTQIIKDFPGSELKGMPCALTR
jgi:SPOR domain